MNLPHHRRYNWKLTFRPYHRAMRLTVIITMLCLALVLIDSMIEQYEEFMSSSARESQLTAATIKRSVEAEKDREYVKNFGAPCTTDTDRQEGTCRLFIKPISWSGK